MSGGGIGWAQFKLTGARSFTSEETGLIREGQSVSLPLVMQWRLPPIFKVTKIGIRTDIPLCIEGGLGDKIYSLPSLYVFEGKVGISPGDEAIYRLVQDKIRVRNRGDCNVCQAINEDHVELVDLIATRLEVLDDLTLRMPVLETTSQEKESIGDKENYIVFCLWGSNPDRSWSEGFLLKNDFGCAVEFISKKSVDLLPLVERANCVVSVNTSLVPMAGALQVPLVAIDTQARTRDFVDVIHAVKEQEAVLAAYHELMSRKRLTCWCGETGYTRSIKENLYILKCKGCGTERQDVKLSAAAIKEFYKQHYHKGWREVIEGLKGYECRFEDDVELAKIRMDQWGKMEGNKWLDVGCGNGALLKALEERDWQASGIDFDSLPALLNGICSMGDWDEAGEYDVISFIDCLEHSFPLEEFELALRHLRSEGKIIVEFPVAQEVPKHYRRLQHLWFWEDETFNKMIAALGMRVERMIKVIPGKRAAIIGRRT